MKKILIGLVASLLSFGALKADLYTNINILSGIGVTNLYLGPCVITEVTAAANTGAVTSVFYDWNASTNVYTNAAYTWRSNYAATVTNIYTSVTGLSMTNYDVGYTSVLVTNVANTNLLPSAMSFSLAANLSVTRPCSLVMEKGLVISATTNINYTIRYRPVSLGTP